jgi:hypothetical protein
MAFVSALRFSGLRTDDNRIFDVSNSLTGTTAKTLGVFTQQLTTYIYLKEWFVSKGKSQKSEDDRGK